MSSDAIVILKADHKEIRNLFRKFQAAGDKAVKTKEKIAGQIIELLTVHTYIENEVMYPEVCALLPDLKDDVLESYEEHHVADVLCMELAGLPAGAERFDAKATVLIENVTHHIDEEEQDWFPKVRAGLARKQLQELGSKLEQARKNAPRSPGPAQCAEKDDRRRHRLTSNRSPLQTADPAYRDTVLAPGIRAGQRDAQFLGRQALVHLALFSGDQRAVPRQQVSAAAAAAVAGRSLGQDLGAGVNGSQAAWPGLGCLGRCAGDLRVGAAHLGQGVELVSTGCRLCRVGAEQGERVLGAQLVPHRLDLDGGVGQAGIPQQRDHLTEDANRPPGLGRLPEHGADRLPETSGIGPIGHHEAAHRLACVKRKVSTARRSGSHIDASAGQASLEGPAVIWRGDHDRHAAVVDGGEKIPGYPLGELLLVTVKQDNMVAAPDIEDLGPGSHGVSLSKRGHNSAHIVRGQLRW